MKKTHNKKLLIIGANAETASLVKKANNMGIETYVTDYNPKSYAKKYAAHPCNVDGSDVAALVNLVKKNEIDAVLVGVAEALIPTYCEVCRILNIPCFASMEQFEIMIDKAKFKDTCRKYQVPVVDEFDIQDRDSIEYPVVVKPVDSSSSKGVYICHDRDELDLSIEKSLAFSKSKHLIVEKYMSGLEVIMYYVIQDGEPTFVAMCDRYTSKEQAGVTQLPSAYIFPSKHMDKFMEEVDESVCNMLKGIGVKNGVLFLQSFIDENGSVRVYEPGFRLNGAQEHMIVSKFTDIDAKELLINYAFDGKMSDKRVRELADPKFKGKVACKLSPLVVEGTIGKILGIEEIELMEGVISVNPNYDVGDVVKGLGTQRQMAANIFMFADTIAQLKTIIDKIIATFKVFDEDGNSMLLKPFDTDILIREYQ